MIEKPLLVLVINYIFRPTKNNLNDNVSQNVI